jgi:type I restriction enzyme S subunit
VDNIISGNYPVVFSNGILKYHNDYKAKAPGVVTGRSGTIGKVTYVEYDFWPHNTSLWVTDFCGNHPLFVFYYFVYIGLEQFGTGSGVPTLNRNDVHRHNILVPNPPEQQKIASCLSSLDEVIAAHCQKLELLKDHKKGLMQNLFPHPSTSSGGGSVAEPVEAKVPKFRFKEFENDGEWVEKSIDTIKSIITDYVANGSFQSLRENLKVVDSEDYAFYVRLTDLRAGLGHSNQKYVDKSTYNFLNKTSLFGGELLMANIGANVGEVWQMPFINKPSTLAPNMIMIKFKKDVDSGFVYQYLTSNTGIKSISSAISGSGHPKISKTDLRQVKVSLPPKIKEQQKIASCLSSLDALIAAQAEKIEQLKLHKKGLMQGLFPKTV